MAWHPLGWTPAFFSEIEKFPSAVLAHHTHVLQLHGGGSWQLHAAEGFDFNAAQEAAPPQGSAGEGMA